MAANRTLSTAGLIVDYAFSSSIGQVIPDNSGNSYYAVSGSTLLQDLSDPVMTDRGAYFTSSKYISLPPNALQPQVSISLSEFYSILYIYIISSGTIFSINQSPDTIFKLYVSSSTVSLSYLDSSITRLASSAASLSNF